MHVIELIQKKRDAKNLNEEEIAYVVNGYTAGSIPDYQISAFLMAVYLNGMDDVEISYLTKSMLNSGRVANHRNDLGKVVDKHSTGGIGDKISIPLAPAVAAFGVRVPMLAGRGLGHTGGTLDKLEAIPGFRVDLSLNHFEKQTSEVGCIIMGQTAEIAPADKKFYALRDVCGTIESIPLIASSIMSKKLAEGIDGLVLDVKFGSGAFMSDYSRAKELALTMVSIGQQMGKDVSAYLTNMDQPLGKYVGNSLEIMECIEILRGEGPKDSTELTIELGAEMLMLGQVATNLEDGREKISEALRSGKAMSKFLEMVRAQGGSVAHIDNPNLFERAPRTKVIYAPQAGFMEKIDGRSLGLAVGLLGGGRCQITDVIDPRVGLEMHVRVGDPVSRGQPLCTIHMAEKGADEAQKRIENAFTIGASAEPVALIGERISFNK